MGQSGGRDARVLQRQALEIAEPGQVHQAGIGDARLPELQHLKLRQPGELRQTGIGDLRQAEIQPAQIGNVSQLFQPGVAAGPGDDVKRLAPGPFFDVDLALRYVRAA